MNKRLISRIALIVLGAVLIVLLAGAIWLAIPNPLLPEANSALRTTDGVRYSDDGGWMAFSPAAGTPRAGFIFYPGGRVSPAAYAPAAAAIAARGFAVYIVPMPFNLAFLGIGKAGDVQRAHSEIKRWAIGGHSLGGSMACEYVAQNPGAVQGLVLWASYPADSTDLSRLPLQAVSIYGSLDAGRDKMSSTLVRDHLPVGAQFVVIEGGNHEQNGYYTGQPNDPPATVSRDLQQARIVAATVDLLERIATVP